VIIFSIKENITAYTLRSFVLLPKMQTAKYLLAMRTPVTSQVSYSLFLPKTFGILVVRWRILNKVRLSSGSSKFKDRIN
jgi:hypothetical protein